MCFHAALVPHTQSHFPHVQGDAPTSREHQGAAQIEPSSPIADAQREAAAAAAGDVGLLSPEQARYIKDFLLNSMSWNIRNPPGQAAIKRFREEAEAPRPDPLTTSVMPAADCSSDPGVSSATPTSSNGSEGASLTISRNAAPHDVSSIVPRVAIVISNYNGVIDGVTLTLNDLMEWLESRGVPCMVLSIDYGDEGEFQETTKGTDLRLLQGQRLLPCTKYKYRTLFSIPQEAFDMLEDFGPSVVHVASPCNLCKAVLEWARSKGIGRIGTFHTDFAAYMEYHGIIIGLMEPAVWWGMRWFYSACTRVLAPTVSMVRRLAEHDVGVPAHPYYDLASRIGIGQDVRQDVVSASESTQQPLLGVWGRGVDLDVFTPSRRSDAFRRKCGLREGQLMILTVSRMVREKNLSTLAGIANSLVSHGVQAKLVVVGDGPEREAMTAACPQAHFTGALYGDELGAAYASGDVFLFVSDTETFGRVNIEAMASGLPVVAAGAGGTVDIVREGVDGFLLPPRQPEAFIAPLKRLLGDAELRQRMGAAALQRSKTYNWELLFQGLLQEYRVASQGVMSVECCESAKPVVEETFLPEAVEGAVC